MCAVEGERCWAIVGCGEGAVEGWVETVIELDEFDAVEAVEVEALVVDVLDV